jgi:uncharacterized protein YndB with AHSA1/START domain
MIELKATACIDAPVDVVWRWLSDLESIPLWVPAIKRAHCPARRRGVGAARVCELGAGTIVETILEWDEGRAFTYRGVGAPGLSEATNTWSVEAMPGNRTLVRSVATATIKGGAFGSVLEPLMRPMFSRLGARSLASLKYLVEHGEPFAGSVRDLPLAPAGC